MTDFDDEETPPTPHHDHEPWAEDLVHWYVWNYGEHPFNQMAAEFADLTGDETVLDIGCGSGCALRHVSRRLGSGRAIGIDPSPAMVNVARRQSTGHGGELGIAFHVAGAEEIPLADQSVDLALAVNSLHHWANRTQALQELQRTLKSGGSFILLEEIFDQPDRGLTQPDAEDLLNRAGFKIVAQQSPLESGRDSAYMLKCHWLGGEN